MQGAEHSSAPFIFSPMPLGARRSGKYTQTCEAKAKKAIKGVTGSMGRTAAKTRALGWGAQTKKFNLVFEDFMRSLGGSPITEDAGNPYMRQEPQRDPGGHQQA